MRRAGIRSVYHTVSRCLLTDSLWGRGAGFITGDTKSSLMCWHTVRFLSKLPFLGYLIRPTNDIGVLMSITNMRLSLKYACNLHILIRFIIIRELTQVVNLSIFNYDTILLKGLLLYFKKFKIFCKILRLPWKAFT